MKRGTTENLKFKLLQDRLGERRYVAAGLLNELWALTAVSAPDGAIGKFSNQAIALGIDYDSARADELIEALLETGWLDRLPDERGRLYIHDWHDHCEDAVHRHLARNLRHFATGSPPRLTRLAKDERERAEAFYNRPECPPETTAGARNAHEMRTVGARNAPQPEPKPEPEPGLNLNPAQTNSQDLSADVAADGLSGEGEDLDTGSVLPKPQAKTKPDPPTDIETEIVGQFLGIRRRYAERQGGKPGKSPPVDSSPMLKAVRNLQRWTDEFVQTDNTGKTLMEIFRWLETTPDGRFDWLEQVRSLQELGRKKKKFGNLVAAFLKDRATGNVVHIDGRQEGAPRERRSPFGKPKTDADTAAGGESREFQNPFGEPDPAAEEARPRESRSLFEKPKPADSGTG